jgi:polyphosphate kinase
MNQIHKVKSLCAVAAVRYEHRVVRLEFCHLTDRLLPIGSRCFVNNTESIVEEHIFLSGIFPEIEVYTSFSVALLRSKDIDLKEASGQLLKELTEDLEDRLMLIAELQINNCDSDE